MMQLLNFVLATIAIVLATAHPLADSPPKTSIDPSKQFYLRANWYCYPTISRQASNIDTVLMDRGMDGILWHCLHLTNSVSKTSRSTPRLHL